MLISYLLPPVLGGVIGYITNDIAIRMLFRPHKPKYLFGWQIPFTPGIIPKEKGRIAAAIGSAISENLMNKEVLERTLLSDELLEKISSSIDSFCENQKKNDESVKTFISHYLSQDELGALVDSSVSELKGIIASRLSESNFGEKIAHMAIEHAKEKMSNGLLGMFGADKLISPVAAIAEPLLAKHIDEMIDNNAGSIVDDMISEQAETFLNQPMSRLFNGRETQIAQAKDTILSLYRTVIMEHLPKMLNALNISAIVEQRINEMDMDEIEPLILQVMDKELKAIVRLGALLGAIIGCANMMV